MDNAMVKRGIGAVVLAIIAALLLGWLLKDKSQDRQDIVEMEIPGVSDMKIPSLSDVTDKVSDSAATLVEETKDAVTNTGSAVIASASGTMKALGDTAADTVEVVTDSVKTTVATATQKVDNTVASINTDGAAKPGFSFRPPTKNEEQQINSATSINDTANSEATANTATSNNTVVASAPKVEVKKEVKKFKPTIENEPQKVVKKVEKKAETPTAKPAATSGGKYSIQLLATSSQSRANKLAKTMNSEGYTSFITQTTSNNKVLYRVRVGGHKNRTTALDAQKSMKRRYQKNFFVQNSLVVSQ